MALASYVVHPSSVAIASKTIRTRGGVFFAVSAIADTCVAQGIAILVFCERNASRIASSRPFGIVKSFPDRPLSFLALLHSNILSDVIGRSVVLVKSSFYLRSTIRYQLRLKIITAIHRNDIPAGLVIRKPGLYGRFYPSL